VRKAFVLLVALLGGISLTACGTSASQTPTSISVPAPSYAVIQTNIAVEVCGSNPQYSLWSTKNGPEGPEAVCYFGNPPIGPKPPSVIVYAACTYNVAKVRIGYVFDCTVNDPSDAGNNPRGSYEEQYQVQLQTPRRGKWWYVLQGSGLNQTSPPAPFQAISYWAG